MKDAAKSINEENEIFENNAMNINFNYNVVENAVVIVKIKNQKLRNIALTRNFRNELIEKNAFNKNTEISMKKILFVLLIIEITYLRTSSLIIKSIIKN